MKKSIAGATLVAAFLLADAWSVTAQDSVAPQPEVEKSPTGYASVAAAREAVMASPGIEIKEENGWTIVVDKSANAMAIWSFSPEGDPRHPSAVRRTVFEQNGTVNIELDVQCESTKPECDALVAEFRQINERIREQIRQGGQ